MLFGWFEGAIKDSSRTHQASAPARAAAPHGSRGAVGHARDAAILRDVTILWARRSNCSRRIGALALSRAAAYLTNPRHVGPDEVKVGVAVRLDPPWPVPERIVDGVAQTFGADPVRRTCVP